MSNEGNGPFTFQLAEAPAGFDPTRAQHVANAPQTTNEVAPTSIRFQLLALGNPLFQMDASDTTGHALLLGVEWALDPGG